MESRHGADGSGGADAAPALPGEHHVTIGMLLAARRHRYEGRPADGATPWVPDDGPEVRSSVRFRAGLGIVGDRYFAQPAHRTASVTFIGQSSLDAVARDLGGTTLDPVATRRNVLLDGVDVDALRGLRFSLDSGAGPVAFQAHRPANPCAWMDRELAPGAFRAMRGRGGVRCSPLTDGALELGPAVLRIESTPT